MLTLFLTFFKIGLFTFGGGYAMIPMITREVLKYEWASQETLTDFIAISESTPGPFAINIATFIGYSKFNMPGAALATLGVILPSFIIILIIAKFFARFSDNKYVKAALSGIRPAVVGLIASATYSIARAQLIIAGEGFSPDWRAIGIFAGVFIISRIKKMHPIWLILISGAAGALLYGVF